MAIADQLMAEAKAFGEKTPFPGIYIYKDVAYIDGKELCAFYEVEPTPENISRIQKELKDVILSADPTVKWTTAQKDSSLGTEN